MFNAQRVLALIFILW